MTPARARNPADPGAERPLRPEAGLALPAAESDAQFLARLGRRVREAREQRGMARKVLARSAQVSERYLALLEGGAGNASIVLLRRVAGALGMPLATLLEPESRSVEQRLIGQLLASLPAERATAMLARLRQELGAEESLRRRRIALLGLRGAGKSTLGDRLAAALHRRFVELDRLIEREAGMALSEVFLLYGQAGYRRIERRCLEQVIESADEIVLSVGGGIVSEPETFDLLLASCYTVWVKAAPEEHMARVLAQGDLRPMSGHAEAMADLRRILAAREPLYARADAVLDTSGQSVEQSLAALRQIASSGAAQSSS